MSAGASSSPSRPARPLTFSMAVALVMGNMIGSGIFLLPASLARFGGVSLIGWLVSAGGALLLAAVFARLSSLAPDAGGPYAYTRHAFGDLPAFLIAWGYWISVWTRLGVGRPRGRLDPRRGKHRRPPRRRVGPGRHDRLEAAAARRDQRARTAA